MAKTLLVLILLMGATGCDGYHDQRQAERDHRRIDMFQPRLMECMRRSAYEPDRSKMPADDTGYARWVMLEDVKCRLDTREQKAMAGISKQ